jgi:hypothetical protein
VNGGVPQIEQFLASLAKAVQRHRNYAPTNRLCVKATVACHQLLVGVPDEQLLLRITPRAMLLPDNTPVGDAPLIQGELTRRLHRAAVGSLAISRNASQGDVARFCRALVDHDGRDGTVERLEDVLQHLGIDRVQVITVRRPAVLKVGSPTDLRLACVRDQQQWRDADLATRGAVGHLYPPNKGWVRLDPACTLGTVSLGDLALIVEDPIDLATMLVQLSDEQTAADPEEAFEQQLEQITHLVRSLNPALVEPMFARLARALISLDATRRKHLLKTTLLPGLLDGRFDGALLRHLPDREMADALAVLADVHVSAPELIMFALDRLGLSTDRRDRIESLVLQSAAALNDDAETDAATPGRIGGYADGRIHVDHADRKSFGDLATYDVAVTAAAAAALEDIQQRIAASKSGSEQVRCVLNLLRLEANPETAERLVERAVSLLNDFQRSASWEEFAFWIGSYRRLSESVAADRPEIGAQVREMVTGYATPSLIQAVIELGTNENRREDAARVLEGLGSAAAAPLVEVLHQEPSRTRRRVLLAIMSLRARAIADGLVPHLNRPQWFVVRNLVYVLGHAGQGYEAAVNACATHQDQRVAREAFRALAQIGTSDALDHVMTALAGRRRIAPLALDALWRFPLTTARPAAKVFLARTDLVLKRPGVARQLLESLAESGGADLRAVVEPLMPLRRRVWNPGAMRLGLRAAALARRS